MNKKGAENAVDVESKDNSPPVQRRFTRNHSKQMKETQETMSKDKRKLELCIRENL